MDNRVSFRNVGPKKEYVKVFYTNGYETLEKVFSDENYAKPFIRILINNPDFHLVDIRKVIETSINPS